jgi:(R)-2-hydroxyacyl-CoA dehydratese activating ATPase
LKHADFPRGTACKDQRRMIVAGCDVGSSTTKAVVMDDRGILAFQIARTRGEAVRSACDVMDRLLRRLQLSHDDVDYCVSTGYGRKIIPFANDDVSEMSCHGRGAKWLLPSVSTVIDGGGQDCKAIRVNEQGMLEEFRINMRCAAGTGRALELMAESCGVDVSELGALALEASDPPVLRKPCCVIAAFEVKHLVLEGRHPSDIAAAISDYVAKRILVLVRGLGGKKEFAMTGGVAKNMGVVRCLERALSAKFVPFPTDPQIVGAVGAALFAADKAKRSGNPPHRPRQDGQ